MQNDSSVGKGDLDEKARGGTEEAGGVIPDGLIKLNLATDVGKRTGPDSQNVLGAAVAALAPDAPRPRPRLSTARPGGRLAESRRPLFWSPVLLPRFLSRSRLARLPIIRLKALSHRDVEGGDGRPSSTSTSTSTAAETKTRGRKPLQRSCVPLIDAKGACYGRKAVCPRGQPDRGPGRW